jgi:hypothetical protein
MAAFDIEHRARWIAMASAAQPSATVHAAPSNTAKRRDGHAITMLPSGTGLLTEGHASQTGRRHAMACELAGVGGPMPNP